jgi:hypothetical protein
MRHRPPSPLPLFRIYSVLNSLGLYNKNAKILFLVRGGGEGLGRGVGGRRGARREARRAAPGRRPCDGGARAAPTGRT